MNYNPGEGIKKNKFSNPTNSKVSHFPSPLPDRVPYIIKVMLQTTTQLANTM
jgi:hypothetical protein